MNEDEIDTLNRLTVIFLETAELHVKERRDLTLDFWRRNVDAILTLQGKEILSNQGHITMHRWKRLSMRSMRNLTKEEKYTKHKLLMPKTEVA